MNWWLKGMRTFSTEHCSLTGLHIVSSICLEFCYLRSHLSNRLRQENVGLSNERFAGVRCRLKETCPVTTHNASWWEWPIWGHIDFSTIIPVRMPPVCSPEWNWIFLYWIYWYLSIIFPNALYHLKSSQKGKSGAFIEPQPPIIVAHVCWM